MSDELIIEPRTADWPSLLSRDDDATVLGRSRAQWRAAIREELGLAVGRPLIATGHQTLLWHPGILAKYLAVEHARRICGAASVNLIVDQHAEGFGSFEVPARRDDGELIVRQIVLSPERPGVPMALHPAFVPPPPPRWKPALPSASRGVDRILRTVTSHAAAPDAARQMAGALAELMARWVEPMVDVTASGLLGTSFARAMLAAMVADPWRCASLYNQAVAEHPEAGIGPLLIREDYVELPLWRTRPGGQRMRAYDSDVERWLEDPATAPRLFPRALLLTALMRLGVCDLFVHGTGGANYDRAMEDWIRTWLGIEPAPIAMVSATLRLPLRSVDDGEEMVPVAEAARCPLGVARSGSAGSRERASARTPQAGSAPRDAERRAGIERTTASLLRDAPGPGRARAAEEERLEQLRHEVERAARRERERPIIQRRTWAFPLYEDAAIDGLARAIGGG